MDNNLTDASLLVNAFQSQTFKRQLELLDEKVQLQEKEFQSKTQILQVKVKTLSELEVKLRNQMTTKDKALHELNAIIKDYQLELMALKKRLCDSEAKSSDMTNEFNQIRAKFQTISSQMKAKDDEYNALKERMFEQQDLKERNDLKIKELVEVMKQYSNELSALSRHNSALESDNFNLQSHLKHHQEELKQMTYERDSAMTELDALRSQNSSLKSINAECNDRIIKSKEDNEAFSKENYAMSQLLAKNTLDLEQFKVFLANSKKEKSALIEANEAREKTIGKANDDFNQLEADFSSFVAEANEEISQMTEWIEKNLCDETSMLNELTERSKMPSNAKRQEKFLGNQSIQFDLIRERLYTAKSKVTKVVSTYEANTCQLNKQLFNQSDLTQKKLEQLYRILCTEIGKITTRDGISHQASNNELINLIEASIFDLLHYSSQVKEKAEKESLLLKEQCKDIFPQIDELKEANQQLLLEITKLTEENKLLDKKNKNLQTVIELKQMQINSQEQRINRRETNQSLQTDGGNTRMHTYDKAKIG